MNEPNSEVVANLPNPGEHKAAISVRADMRRRELVFNRELLALTASLGDQEMSTAIKNAENKQHDIVTKALRGQNGWENGRDSEIKLADCLDKARSYQDWAPNMAALYFAKAAQVEQLSGRDPSNLLVQAKHFIDESKNQGIPKNTPGDFLPDAIVLWIQRKIIEKTALPTPSEAAMAVASDSDLLEDYALVLPESQRAQFLGALPEENRIPVSLRLDAVVSEVLKTIPIHTEDDSRQRNLIK